MSHFHFRTCFCLRRFALKKRLVSSMDQSVRNVSALEAYRVRQTTAMPASASITEQ